MSRTVVERPLVLEAAGVRLEADFAVPDGARGLVMFAHGSGSSRKSWRNRYVAAMLQSAGFATLLLDLLTPEEERIDADTGHLRFDIGLLAGRLIGAAEWIAEQPAAVGLPLGLFGASTGGGAALVAAARIPDRVLAVVSRGGRPDLAGDALSEVTAPTLLIVGGNDRTVLAMNREAMGRMRATVALEIVAGATHLFEESGTLERVAELARNWFLKYLTAG